MTNTLCLNIKKKQIYVLGHLKQITLQYISRSYRKKKPKKKAKKKEYIEKTQKEQDEG